jgi:hypothetical protein
MDELGIALDAQAAARGLDAWRLADALRREHGVESVEPEWDYVSYLQGALADAQTKQAKRRSHWNIDSSA